jgi:Glycosyltransferases involved in cell wall biogenesis
VRPKVSVLIPVYNTEKYLARCIESVLCQTLEDFEVIIVNDGSTDSSINILNEYASKDNRIIIVNKENGGAPSARNIAIPMAKGEYISFVDSDDWIAPNMLSESYKKAKETHADIIVFNFNRAYHLERVIQNDPILEQDIIVSKDILGEFSYKYLFEMKGSSVWNKLYRSEFLHKYNLYMGNVRIGEDLFFNLHALIHLPKISMINRNLYYYFVNEKSITRSYAKKQIDDYATCLKEISLQAQADDSLKELHKCLPLIAFRGFSTALFNQFQYNKNIISMYKCLRKIMDNKEYLYWIRIEKKYNSTQLISNKIYKLHNKVAFFLLSNRLYAIATLLEWVRFKFFTVKKRM